MLVRLLTLFFSLFFIGGTLGKSTGLSDIEKKVIETKVLGNKIYSLYESFNFLKIEIDNEYADLRNGEQYWIAVDSRYEYLTLRTLNNVVIEIIIRNPDLETERGIKIGDTLSQFLTVYPEAKQLTHYAITGVPRREVAFSVEGENIEISISKNQTVKVIKYLFLQNLKDPLRTGND